MELSRYFDHNATTPMGEHARAVWLEAEERFWQNPSSLYREAAVAKQQLEDCRERLADHLGVEEPGRIVFTSGATEANNAAVRRLLRSGPGKEKRKLAISAIEHPCVAAAAEEYGGSGDVAVIPVNPRSGVIEMEVLGQWLRRGELRGVSVMAANNETGVLQPWEDLAHLCREHGVPFHSDAAQWIGKLPAVGLGRADFATGSGHKFGGGRGVGFLVVPEGDESGNFHLLAGGPQEEGRRAGTENLSAILAMTAALLEKTDEDLQEKRAARSAARDAFEEAAVRKIGIAPLGKESERLWNTSLFVLPHGKNVKWLARLNREGFCVSTGSACSAGRGNPSRVMAAMGLGFEEMGRVVRVSGGWQSSEADWLALADALAQVDGQLREGESLQTGG